MKIRKDPYCVGFHHGFTPHSTHLWGTPHSFSMTGVTDKTPIPHIPSTLSKYQRTQAGKPPIPHTFCVIFIFTPISHSVLQIYPHFVSTQFHTIFQFSTLHSTPNSVRACYSTFWASRPPGISIKTSFHSYLLPRKMITFIVNLVHYWRKGNQKCGVTLFKK